MNDTMVVCIMYICKERFFFITEIMRMDEKTGTGVSSDKEMVKESQSQSQSQSRKVTPPLDTPTSGAGLGASQDSKGNMDSTNLTCRDV